LNVVNFPDRLRADASRNLNLLIERARNSEVFAGTVNFDDPVWDLSAVKIPRPSAKSAQLKLYFSTQSEKFVRGVKNRIFMPERFAAFVKTMIVLREEANPVSLVNHGALLRVARALYAVMEVAEPDPADLVSADFVAAANDIKMRKNERGNVGGTANSRHSHGNILSQIADFINRHSLSKVHITFFNPFPKVPSIRDTIGDDGRKARSEKMATKEEMGAIIDASISVRKCHDDQDLLRMSVVELMCCAPVRINEVLDTRSDCERTGKFIQKASGDEMEYYLGYAHSGSKGAPDGVKYIPSAMVDIADRALADAKRITEPFREIARWMEDHPGRAYLAEPFRLADPDMILTRDEVERAVGLAKRGGHQWLDLHGLHKHDGRPSRVRLGDVEAVILRQQLRLPNPKVKLSDYMFVVPKNYFHPQRATQNCILTVVGDNQISEFLGNHTFNESVFQKFEILDEQNKPYRINTHSIRHFLNTVAQEVGLSQLDIARWSGRKDVRQNAVYDHSGGIPLARDIRKVLETDAMRGPVVDTAAALSPSDRETFLSGRFATAHFTSIGACIQDFSLAPCPSHGACAGCSEHLVVKGKPEHLTEAERLLQEHRAMLDAARTEMAEGTYNASAWVEHNERVLDGLKKAVAVHNDPKIPSGTIVQI
jgi:hypothetical protein